MTFELSGSDRERVEKLIDAEQVANAQARQVLVRTATTIVDALAGKLDAVSPVQTESIEGAEQEFSKVPTELPRVNWTKALLAGIDEVGNDKFVKIYLNGTLGEFASDMLAESGTSTVFDTAFYAGVLAAKAGLVDVDQFTHDSRLPNSLDFLDK